MRFVFGLQSVLTVRQHERDMEQQSLAAVRKIQADHVAEYHRLLQERASVIETLRLLHNTNAQLLTDQIIDRQRYAEQLAQAVLAIEVEIESAAKAVEICVQRLVIANQSVRSLEKLCERQQAEFQAKQAASAVQELDEATRFRR